ncbi:MAG TPA: aldehyde ferredoxin oxidoreductase family protein [Anaerolineaceae bacterium]|nr:aldehyde ferredoxin oxidoreductase family protein [Anaerolineaceae bacterium]HOG78784.1 aldehyde ferredoxin oxidoreductase family protein [Anaerolineaceae bacterium]
MNAVMGKVLWVDLTTGKIEEEQIPDGVYEKVLSGLGLAAYLLYQRIPPGADPLGPENVLGFVSGLLTGTGSVMTGRWMAAAKSPLTGTWGDANCGGTLAPAIKQCGYDGIFFTGISPTPVYLHVEHGHAELRDASDLWGKDTRETETALWERFEGRPAAVACIGMAGEKCSLIAGISNDQGRMAARSGLGAVMGAKRLKAIALHGAYRIPVHDAGEVQRLSDRFNRWIAFQPPFLPGKGMGLLGTLLRVMPLSMRQDGLLYKVILRKWGTTGMNQTSIEMGDSPIQNWRGSSATFKGKTANNLDPDRIIARETVKYHCYSCPLGCGGYCSLKGGGETHKPEYETVLALSGLLMHSDLDQVFEWNERLNRAGMDSISAGGSIAFALECFEQGLLTLEDTGGLALTWGNTAAIDALLDQMIRREGLGALLADGSRAAAQRLGKNASEYAVQAGGQELAMHDGRNDPGFALHAVVEPTPGRHTLGAYLYYEMFQLWKVIKGLPPVRLMFYPKGHKYRNDAEKGVWGAACSNLMAAANGAGLCMFGALVGLNRIPFFQWLNAATGWDKTPEAYMQIGWTIQNLRQAFNLRQGAPLRHAINARATGQPPQTEGANQGRTVPLDGLVRAYYTAMHWDPESGHPDVAAVTALGLPAPTEK